MRESDNNYRCLGLLAGGWKPYLKNNGRIQGWRAQHFLVLIILIVIKSCKCCSYSKVLYLMKKIIKYWFLPNRNSFAWADDLQCIKHLSYVIRTRVGRTCSAALENCVTGKMQQHTCSKSQVFLHFIWLISQDDLIGIFCLEKPRSSTLARGNGH